MLIAGNYRCVLEDSVRPIKEAVHSNLDESRAVYNWVVELCVKLGADEKDMVPFEKYANAALSLGSPSSAARALAAGAPYIERGEDRRAAGSSDVCSSDLAGGFCAADQGGRSLQPR